MRPARALCPSRLAGLMLLALTTASTGNYKGSLICQQPKTKVCRSWLLHSVEVQNSNNEESLPSSLTRENCGFSKLKAFPPNQKLYKVSQLHKNQPHKTLHCQRIIIFGPFVDWIKINYAMDSIPRSRRQTFTPRGRYRGQTQSQYLAIDRGNGKDEGKAEAHSAADSSRASVSGNSGMGQAQSQTIYDPNCEDCYGRPQVEVENLKHPGSSRPVGNGYGQNTGSVWPGVNHGQGNNIPNHGGYRPIDTQGFNQGKVPSSSSGSENPDFYGPKSKLDGYGGTGPNNNIDYNPPGTYGKPTSNIGNKFSNNRPFDSGTNGYDPNNIGGYDTKNVPGNNYKNTDGIYRPIGSGTNNYQPFGNGVYDPIRNGAPNTNGVGNIYTSGYPNRGIGLTPGDSTGGGVYRPSSGNSNRFGPGGSSTYDTVIKPSQGSGKGLGPGQTEGQGVGSGQGAGPMMGPGQGSGQGIGPGQGLGPDQGVGQGLGPGQGLGQGLGPSQGIGQGGGPGQGIGQGGGPSPGIGQGMGPGQGIGQGMGPGQDIGQGMGPGQSIGQGIRPGQGSGQGIGPGQGLGQGLGPSQGIGQGGGPGQGMGQGVGPGQGLGQGVGPSQGIGQGIGPGQGIGQGVGSIPGIGQGIGPGQGSGQGIGPGQGSGQGMGPGHGIGQGMGPGQGIGQGIGPGQGSGQGIGPGQGSGQGMGPGHGIGQGMGPGQGIGQGIGPGQGIGQGIGPGQGIGQGIGPGQGIGQGIGPGQGIGQGVGPGQGIGQGVRPSQGIGQGVGPGQGIGQGIGPGQGIGQGVGPGQGIGQGIGPGQGTGQGVGPGQGIGQGIGPGQGAGDSRNGLPRTVGEYEPYQRGLGNGYEPNQSNLGGGYRPVQGGLGSGPYNRDTNWPMASGPYAGPGGRNYYCCFVPNTGTNGNNLNPNNYGVSNTIHDQSNLPGGQLGSGINGPNGATNQYGTNNDRSITQLPVSQYGTHSGNSFQPGGHLGTGPTTDVQYRPDGRTNTLTQPSPYGTGFDNTFPLKPGGQLETGIAGGPNIGSQYNPSLSTGIQPSNYGTGMDSTRPLKSGGQLGTGPNGRTVGSSYGPGVGQSNLPNGQTGIGSGPPTPGGQYSTNVGNVPHQQYGTFNPNEQNGGKGDGIYNGQPLPGGQYNNEINRGISPGQYGSGNFPGNNSPGNRYNTGIDGAPVGSYSESSTPVRQYGTGPVTSQSVPGTQVGPGGYTNQHGSGDNSGLTSPGQQYGTGPDISGTYPAGRQILTGADQNRPIGTDTANYPGSPYGAGSLDGPTKSYGLGNTGLNSPTGPTGLYSNGPNVQGQPYGSDRGHVPSYGNGNLNYNSNKPGVTYQGGNGGEGNGGMTNGQGGGNNNNGAPIDGTSRSPYGPYNTGGTGVQNNEYSGGPQNYIDPNSIDGDDSEAEASVAQGINGTIASASAKGGNDKGRAQTNVHGTYTGSGSFQAQAQITGDNKEAQSEVSGGKKGASSSASGSGRNNKSQANVQLGSETGSVQTQSQSAGVMHSSNSQVQGSIKGGMADAQAKGPGSTSSQAQIGFTPYKDTDKSNHDLQKTPFAGGGVASAQSSGRTGQSQSQLHGTFKYGITYNGAAQSGASLDKDAVFPNRLSFEKIDVFDENEKNINVDMTETPQSLNTEIEPHLEPSSTSEPYNFANETDVTTTENVIDETMENSDVSHTHLDHHKTDDSYLSGPTLSGNKKSFSTNHINNPGTDYEFSTVKDELPPESEYDTDEPYNPDGSEESDLAQGEYSNYDEFARESPTHQSLLSSNRKPLEVRQSTGGNTQHIVLGSLRNHNAEIIQKNSEIPDENKVYLAGERIPGTGGYTVPAGFTGSVKSVASKDSTYVVGYRDSPSQAQTVTLTPGAGKIKYTYPPAYGKHVMPKNLRSLYSPKDDNKYLSVSKSVTRALDSENNIRKQYSHTYYTKSSSCGYFTFTCTMVSSAEGRKKVCKPKIPTNPDGTQIRC